MLYANNVDCLNVLVVYTLMYFTCRCGPGGGGGTGTIYWWGSPGQILKQNSAMKTYPNSAEIYRLIITHSPVDPPAGTRVEKLKSASVRSLMD